MVFCNNNYGVRAFPVDVSVTGSVSARRHKLVETSNIAKRQGTSLGDLAYLCHEVG